MAARVSEARLAPEEIVISSVQSPEEIEEYQDLERRAWDSVDLEIIPAHVLLTHRRYGGLLLVARDRSGAGMGLLLGFPGLKSGQIVHCSHLLGVLPEWRGRDVGYWLKRRQRELVIEQGLDLVVWTFDPLETRNARLNLRRLGGICREYTPNLYGTMRDGLNAGLESDRLTVEWHIRRRTVEVQLAGEGPGLSAPWLLADGMPLLTHTTLQPAPDDGAPLLALQEARTGRDGPLMLLEVPSDFQRIKAADLAMARAWRGGVRAIFEDLFARGYAAIDLLVHRDEEGRRRCHYLVGPYNEYLQREEW